MNINRPNIVVLDGYTLNPGDLSWNKLKALGHTVVFDHSPAESICERAKDAEIVLANKVKFDDSVLSSLPKLRFISITATGFNNIDVDASRSRNIAVSNVVGYAAESVAQHVFAMMLEFTNNVARHHRSVVDGQWAKCPDFSYTLSPISELSSKTIGIYGLGRIGKKVADIASGFGMRILATHKHPERDRRPDVQFVELDQLFAESDFLTLHAPLSDHNAKMINRSSLQSMKPTAFLINTGRGGLIDEEALLEALQKKHIAGAALDVLGQEPPPVGHPLIGLENCLVTPHQAWASRESRQRLMDATVENVRCFIDGSLINIVNGWKKSTQ